MTKFFYWCFNFENIKKTNRIILSVLFSNLLVLIDYQFSFTFVQSAILLTTGYYTLINPNRNENRAYNSWSIIVNMPISFVGWVEAFGCERGVKKLGGHLVYDATIPISTVMFIIWNSWKCS